MKKVKEEKRESVIIKTSIIGIFINLLLVIFKTIIGLISNSIAIILDAVNNLSDALSSIVTIITTKLAESKPIILKLLLGKYVKNIGEKFNSPSLVASGSDATSDAILSSSVLISAIIYIFTNVNIEAYVGVLISIFIIKAGIEIFMEAINEILGKRVDKKTINEIKKTICKIENVYGAYDLMLHNYGPDKYVGSVHIEIPDSMTAEEIDPLERHISNIVLQKHNVYLSGITIYSMNTKNEDIAKLRYKIYKIVMSNDGVLEFHGFYLEEKNKSIRFDIIIDYSIKNREEIYNKILNDVKKEYPDHSINIKVDIDI